MIYIDNRAGSKDLAPYLPKTYTQLTRLRFGDVAFEGNGPDNTTLQVGVEHKRINDAVSCMASGRFAGFQLPGMHKLFDRVYLLIEGNFKSKYDGIMIHYSVKRKKYVTAMAHRGKPVTLHDFLCWLTTMNVQGGCHLIFAPNTQQSAQTIQSLYRWWQKKWSAHKSIHVLYDSGPDAVPLFGTITPVRKVASQLSGVGWGKSREIDNVFGSVFDMCVAEEKDWCAIEGIGKKLAKTIMKELRGDL